jgi:hypothetical protein
VLLWKCNIRRYWENIFWIIVVGRQNSLLFKFISHNTILHQVILFLSRTVFIFFYILSAKTNTPFLINLKLKKIMYLNVSMGDYAIFQEHKVQEFNYNSYDDIGIFWPSYSPIRSHLLIDYLYVGRILLLN